LASLGAAISSEFQVCFKQINASSGNVTRLRLLADISTLQRQSRHTVMLAKEWRVRGNHRRTVLAFHRRIFLAVSHPRHALHFASYKFALFSSFAPHTSSDVWGCWGRAVSGILITDGRADINYQDIVQGMSNRRICGFAF
jgi:hypothetical protein